MCQKRPIKCQKRPTTPVVGQQPVHAIACHLITLLTYEEEDTFQWMIWQICAQDHTFVSTTIKGARTSNEDTHFSDGRFFSLFDGHGGQLAARMCRAQLSQHFCHLLESGKFLGPAPKPVQVCAPCVTVCWTKLRHGRGPSDGGLFFLKH